MGITINIAESSAAPASVASSQTAAVPLDAGASVALASTSGSDVAAHAHTPDQAISGGAPSVSLVQEIEGALGKAGASSNASSFTDGVNAGAAPL